MLGEVSLGPVRWDEIHDLANEWTDSKNGGGSEPLHVSDWKNDVSMTAIGMG